MKIRGITVMSVGLAFTGTLSCSHTTRDPAATAPGPQDIEWSIADALPNSLRPPDGMMVPGEMKLAGPRTIAGGEPFRCWLRAVPPALLGTYDGVYRKPDLRPELIVELRNAQGKVIATQRPPFSEATLLKGGHPAYYDVLWQALPLAAKGLPAGEYVVVATIEVAGRIPLNRVEKRLRVLSAAEVKQARSQELTPQALAAAAGLAVMGIEGAAPGAPGEAALLPAGKSLQAALPGRGRVAVYGLSVVPSSEFTATVGGTTRQVPAVKDTGYLLRERFLGVGQGGADTLQIEATSGPLRLAGVRVEPLDPKVSLVPRSGNGGKALVVNNDGGSEGFWSPSWDPNQLPEMVERYQGSDVSQFEFSTNLGEMANYRSRYVDFHGEGVEKWPTKGYEAQRRHYLTLDQHEPRLFPWLAQRSREIGLVFWGSQRMNADYSGHAEYAELFHSRFQKEHPEMRVLHSPKQTTPSFYLSYAQAAVRERRIGVLRELAEFGCEGVNLDFCRYPNVLGYEAPMPTLFRQAHGEDGTKLPFDDPRWVRVRQQVMNGFMREVRAVMEAEAGKRGEPVLISVRLPATKYETFGFDPQTWAREGLVDALIPAFPGPERWFDIEPWVAMTQGTKVQVWPGTEYYFHETAGAELTDADVARGLKPGYQFWLKRSDYLRRAAEAYAAGADGFHMFNAWGKKHVTLTRGISDPAFVADWRRYLDPENLHSEIAADPARNEHLARRREAAHRQRRLIFNNDGDDCVTILRSLPSTPESLLARRTTPLLGSQVDSIFYCSLCGPKSYHPSNVSETYTKSMDLAVEYYGKDTPTGQYFARVKNIVPDLIAQGTDPLKVMVEFSRANDIEIFCSMRMNDTHDGAHRPDKPYPDWPRFKEENPEYLTGSFEKKPRHGAWTAYDYGQAAVRDRKFRRLEEVCRNYDVDGIELDFFRHGVLFRSVAWGGKASAEELDMMTDLIRRLHRMTVEEGMKRGKPILIAVRVPDSVEYSRGIGLDIERWLSEGLVDILITTCYFRLNPWEYSVELGHRYGVPVYASLSESRVNEKVEGEDGEFTRQWNTLSYRARAMEAWQAGVDGIYMFNFFNPNRPEWRELGDPKTLAGLDKLYFVTCRNYNPNMWLAGGAALQNRTILTPANPAEIGRGAPAVFDLRVGDDLSGDALADRTVALTLHLRVQGLKEASEADVRLNGHRLENGTLTGDRLVYPVAPEWVRRGANRVEAGLRAQAEPAGSALEVMYRGDRLLTMPGQLPWRRLFEAPN